MKIKDIIIFVLSIVGIITMILFFTIRIIDNHNESVLKQKILQEEYKESLFRQKKLQLEIEKLSKPINFQNEILTNK